MVGKLRTLTKAELAKHLFETIGLNRREATEFLDGLFEEITLSLSRGEEVQLTGFGRFALRDKPARPGRNPRGVGKGAEVTISARRVVTFRPSQLLKKQIEGGIHRDVKGGK